MDLDLETFLVALYVIVDDFYQSHIHPRLPQLRGLPVLLTHGTDDPVLLHATAVRLRDAMHAAGANVTWLEYPGGHEIAPAAAAAAADFLARLFSAASWSPAR